MDGAAAGSKVMRPALTEAALSSIGIGLIRRRNPHRSVRIYHASLAGIILYAKAAPVSGSPARRKAEAGVATEPGRPGNARRCAANAIAGYFATKPASVISDLLS
jgi:hypothetical protein